MMPTIRVSTPEDLEKAQYICIQTADKALRKNKKIERITAALFADYYICHEPQNCFVLEENGEVLGYILSCTDIKGFCRAYRGEIFKTVCSLSPLWAVVCLFVPLKYVLWHSRYPAHLHIDLLPQVQSAGFGSEMMKTLLAHLKENGVRGVMLSCGAKNTRAVHFYQKFGFHTLLKLFQAQVMAKEL